MSVLLMAEVWKREDLDTPEKIIMLALPDHANDEGECYPSVGLLSRKASMSDRGVQKVMRRLEERGFVITKANAGRKGSNHFTLHLPAVSEGDTPEPGSPPNDVHPEPGSPHPRTGFTPTPEPGSPEPSYNHQEPCVGGATAHTPSAFDEFWEAHPRQRDRERCRRLFAEAVAAGVSPSRIIEAAKRYRVEQTGNKVMYLAYAASWLEHRRWEDYPDSPPPAARSEGVLRLAQFWAGKVRAKKHIAPSAISEEVAACMIANGMVTQRDLLAAGLQL